MATYKQGLLVHGRGMRGYGNHTTLQVSFMTKQNMLQLGMAAGHRLPVPWTHNLPSGCLSTLCDHFVNLIGALVVR